MNNNIVTHLIIVTYYLEFIYMNEQPHAHSQAPMRAKYMMGDITAPDNTVVIMYAKSNSDYCERAGQLCTFHCVWL